MAANQILNQRPDDAWNIEEIAKRIGKIAELCGSDSPDAFSRTFKNEMGISPKDDRKASSPQKL